MEELVEERPVMKPLLNKSNLKKIDVSGIPKNKPLSSFNSEDCTYHVICGSFSILENAYKRKEELLSLGYSAEVIIGSKLNYVSSSCHSDRSLAEVAGKDLKSRDGFSSWILKR